MTTWLHLLTFALTPKYYSFELLSMSTRVAPYRDVEVNQVNKAKCCRLFIGCDMWDAMRVEFVDLACSNSFSIDAFWDKYKFHAHSWCYIHWPIMYTPTTTCNEILSQVSFIKKIFHLLSFICIIIFVI